MSKSPTLPCLTNLDIVGLRSAILPNTRRNASLVQQKTCMPSNIAPRLLISASMLMVALAVGLSALMAQQ
jgi:hypothetical protein